MANQETEHKGIFGKIMEHVTPDKQGDGGLLGKAVEVVKDRFDGDHDEKDKERERATPDKDGGGGLFGKAIDAVKDRVGGDDDEKDTKGGESAAGVTRGGMVPGAPADQQAGNWRSGASGQATQTAAGEGQVTGAGMNRVYTTRAGDSLAAIAAYFYGDAVHVQRLYDDNPELNLAQYGDGLPGGVRIKVSEDASRGDTVKNAGY